MAGTDGEIERVVVGLLGALDRLVDDRSDRTLELQDLVHEATLATEELVVADEELRAQADELAVSRDAVDAERERYARLFELLPDAVLETDGVGQILEANAAAVRLLGVPGRSVLGKLFVSFVDGGDRRRVRRALREPPTSREDNVITLVSRGGGAHVVEISVSSQGIGPERRVIWALRDLTDVVSMTSEIARLGSTVNALPLLIELQRLSGAPDPAGEVNARRLAAAVARVFPDHDVVVRVEDDACGAGSIGEALANAETRLRAGPSIEAIERARGVDLDVAAVQARWPVLGALAGEHDRAKVVAAPVVLDGEPVAALTLWCPHGSSVVDGHLSLIAEHIAVRVANERLYRAAARRGDNLHRALERRGVIEQAKGMVMATHGVTADDAFVALRRRSQDLNVKLRDVALDIVERRATIPH